MGNDTQRKRILAVNDDPAILELFHDLLSDEGYDVTTDTFLGDTRELHHTILDMQPDLVILDFIIGDEGGGWQLLQTLQMDPKTEKIPIVVCTGAVKQVDELSAHLEKMGIKVVIKPFNIDHLYKVVASVWE